MWLSFKCPHCSKVTMYTGMVEVPSQPPRPLELTHEEKYKERPVEELMLSFRSYNCLQNASIKTVGELIRHTPAELLAYKNFGRRSLNEVIELLRTMNLSLAERPHDHC